MSDETSAQPEPISISAVREQKRQRLTRRLLASAVYYELPTLTGDDEPRVSMFVTRGGRFDFVVSPALSQMERTLVAYGSAMRIERGEDVYGFTRAEIREAAVLLTAHAWRKGRTAEEVLYEAAGL